MSKAELIYNSHKSSHLSYILQFFEEAEEIWIGTAFLKNSGLNLIQQAIKKHLKNKKSISILAGQNFGLTEPVALIQLHKLMRNNPLTSLRLDLASEKNSVFHPKLYLFKMGKKARIIAGSANLTRGGLISNQEISTVIKCNTEDQIWKKSIDYFNERLSPENSKKITAFAIKQYESYYIKQKKTRQHSKPSPRGQQDFPFNLELLKEYLAIYRDEEFQESFSEREKDYRKAKKLLNEICDSEKLSKARYIDILELLVGKKGQGKLWKSGSLLRHKTDLFSQKTKFRKLVKLIRDNKKLPADELFEVATAHARGIYGAAVNYVTEIMMSYRPNKFANLNKNPITVLKEEAGIYWKSHSSSFTGANYAEYCEVVLEICEQLELKNMLEADSFFNEIYWDIQ